MRQKRGSRRAEPVREVTFSEVVAEQVRKFRKERGWSARELAERCARAGMPAVDRAVIANLETKRRKSVSVDEVMMFAFVLDVAPIHLLVPDEDETTEDDGTEVSRTVRVTAEVAPSPTDTRSWIRGLRPLPGTDFRRYWSQVPAAEFEAPDPRALRYSEKYPEGYIDGDVEDELKREAEKHDG